jgi:sulfonate transport system substrate-binding protein
VKTVADLKGKNVVVSSARGSIAEYLLANALQQAGLKYSDVKVQYVLPTAAQAAFSSQKIQNWATFGVYQATALAGGGRQIVDGQNGRTSGLGFVSAASSSIADPSKKAAIADVLKRLDRAVRWSVANKDAYVTAFTKATGVAPAVADTVVSQGATTALPVSSAVVTKVQAVADLMHGIGSLPTDVKVADQVDASLFTG